MTSLYLLIYFFALKVQNYAFFLEIKQNSEQKSIIVPHFSSDMWLCEAPLTAHKIEKDSHQNENCPLCDAALAIAEITLPCYSFRQDNFY